MLHGEAARLPWDVLSASADAIEAEVTCVRYPLRLSRQIRLEGNSICTHSTVTNLGISDQPITHGEHPCFDRSVFAGGSLALSARSACVLPPLDPDSATLAEGDFEWPFARTLGGEVVDLSVIPRDATGTHDHVALELAHERVALVAADGLKTILSVRLDEHPFMLFWRNHRAPGPPSIGEWDVFALEPQSSPGRSVQDALDAGAVTPLRAGMSASYAMTLELSRSTARTGDENHGRR
jgi:galactose mutarotase-like enzyme